MTPETIVHATLHLTRPHLRAPQPDKVTFGGILTAILLLSYLGALILLAALSSVIWDGVLGYYGAFLLALSCVAAVQQRRRVRAYQIDQWRARLRG